MSLARNPCLQASNGTGKWIKVILDDVPSDSIADRLVFVSKDIPDARNLAQRDVGLSRLQIIRDMTGGFRNYLDPAFASMLGRPHGSIGLVSVTADRILNPGNCAEDVLQSQEHRSIAGAHQKTSIADFSISERIKGWMPSLGMISTDWPMISGAISRMRINCRNPKRSGS